MERLQKSWLVTGSADSIIGDTCPDIHDGESSINLWVRSVSVTFTEPRKRDQFLVLKGGREQTVLEVIRVPRGAESHLHEVKSFKYFASYNF